MKNFIFILFCIFTITACGDEQFLNVSELSGSSQNPPTLNGAQYVVFEGSLTSTPTAVSGTGSFIFMNPRAQSCNNFKTQFTLEDQGQLVLWTNAQAKLQNGIGIKFVRDGKNLKVFLVGRSADIDVTNRFKGIDASKTLTLFLDVHNSENPAHVVVWNQNLNHGSIRYNSGSHGKAPPKGLGNLWGYSIKKAKIVAATAGKPAFDHHH